MNLNLLSDIRKAYSNLNPDRVRELAEKNVSIGILASSEEVAESIRSYFHVPGATVERVRECAPAGAFGLLIAEPDYPRPKNAFVFHFRDPGRTVEEILDNHQNLEIALARNYPVFRDSTIDRVIHRVAQENALFSIVTALPNVVPNLLELPWALGEFASDTAFITMNQVRMAFLLAACHNKNVGYGDQKLELTSIVASAFGWRAIARELAGKIPLGGGLIPKAAISYGGTFVIGKGVDRLHRTGVPLSRKDRRDLYTSALERGKQVVGQIVTSVKNRNAA